MKTFNILLPLMLLVLVSGIVPPPDPLVVIVNSQNSVTELSLTEVRIYWMRRPKKRWETINKAIRPVDRKEQCVEKKKFYEDVIKMNEEEVEVYFSARQYQNGENPPDKFSSDKEIISFIGNETGAIGYVKSSSLTYEALAKVKVIFTLPM